MRHAFSLLSAKSGIPAGGWGLVMLLLSGCSSGPAPTVTLPPQQVPPPDVREAVARPAPRGQPAGKRPDARSWARRTLDGLTLRRKIGQMIMPSLLGNFSPVGSAGHERALQMVEELEVGGLLMSVGSPTEVAVKLNELQAHARIPLLVSADLETGAGFRFRGAVQMPGTIELGGATDFPTLMAVGATGDTMLAYEMGRVTAIEARAIGIQVPFAPVLDVNNNPENPIINVRSFGGRAAGVAALGSAFVRGVQDHGAIATGKHFPGHGDTDTDTHLTLPVIRYGRARLDSVELRPFQAAIDAGIGAIMTAHITVPALNGGTRDPATLSPFVITDLLRGRMGFHGLVFTDAMDMGALTRHYKNGEAALRAVEAGADILVQPLSVEQVLDAIENAVRLGRIAESRIDESVLRILEAKQALGLDRGAQVDVAEISRKVGTPEHVRVAEEVARRSITVLRNGRNLLSLRGTRSARVLSVTFRRTSDVLAGRYFNRRLRRTYPRLVTADLDRDAAQPLYDGLLRRARRSRLVVISAYVTAVSGSGSVGIPDRLVNFIRGLKAIGVPHIVVSFGSPYLVRAFPDVQAYMLAWSGAEVSQRAAAEALFGGFEISGHTPTAIPPLFEMGEGIRIPAKEHHPGGNQGD